MFRRGNRCLERFIVGPKNRNPVDIILLSLSSVFLTQKMFNIQGIPGRDAIKRPEMMYRKRHKVQG